MLYPLSYGCARTNLARPDGLGNGQRRAPIPHARMPLGPVHGQAYGVETHVWSPGANARSGKGATMLANVPLMTMLPVVDMDRARSFYEGKLGLQSAGTNP